MRTQLLCRPADTDAQKRSRWAWGGSCEGGDCFEEKQSYKRLVPTRMPTRNPNYGVCANNYAMGVPLTPISPTLRHGPPNALCRSVARNYQFPCQGNEIVGKGGVRGGEGSQGGQQNWCSRQSVVGGFFRFFALGIFSWNFWERKKVAGNSPAGPLIQEMLCDTLREMEIGDPTGLADSLRTLHPVTVQPCRCLLHTPKKLGPRQYSFKSSLLSV